MIEVVECLGKLESHHDYCIDEEWVRKFFYRFLFHFSPSDNSLRANSRIIRAVMKHSNMLQSFVEYNSWRGNALVINELLKKLKDFPDPFKVSGWQRVYSDQLAIHLAAAGKLDDAIRHLRKTAS
jgi:hypothetical protein